MSDFGLDADVVVAIGSAFSGVTPPPTTRPPSRPRRRPSARSCSRPRPRDPGDFFLLPEAGRLQAALPVARCRSAPATARPSRAATNAFRVYPLGKHGKALAVDARTGFDSSHAWGLRYTTWIDAPILEQPTRQVCWDKHQVRVYTNGAAIHRIAVFYGGEACKAAGGVVVWIDNSLDDKLSPETMIAIARSLVPGAPGAGLILDTGRAA